MPEKGAQGSLRIIHDMDTWLSEICGMDRFTLQPVAGAHGELTGLFIIRAYHLKRGDPQGQDTRPRLRTARTRERRAAGMTVVQVASDSRGNVDIEDLKAKVGPDTAGLMLTNPNTLGLFDEQYKADNRDKGRRPVYYDGRTPTPSWASRAPATWI